MEQPSSVVADEARKSLTGVEDASFQSVGAIGGCPRYLMRMVGMASRAAGYVTDSANSADEDGPLF